MGRKKTKIAVQTITNFWNNAAKNTMKSEAMETEFSTAKFKRSKAGNYFQFIPQKNNVSIDPVIFENATAGEKSLIIQILSQLKKNNCLWYFDYRNTSVKGTAKERAVLSLRKKGILHKTEIQGLHIVNPFLIRRGGIINVIVASNQLINETDTLSKKSFKHLDMYVVKPKCTSC